MSDYIPLRSPLSNMSFTPDVPSNALGPSEYNSGKNVETDVRGIKKIYGENYALSAIPGHVIFIDGGFRNGSWVYIVATREGVWYMVTSSGISNITPGVGANPSVTLSGYSDDTRITASWVGSVFFINDQLRPPMYFGVYYQSGGAQTEIAIYGTGPDNFVWNYESGLSPAVNSVTAGFVRNYSSPNLGNLLVAGNLTKSYSTGITVNYPTTIRWSQQFPITGVPTTWQPTLSNVANEQEVNVRGPLIDGFFIGGSFYVCSYWDTVVLAPLNYQNSSAPVFAVKQFCQGSGLINQNAWCQADTVVYGVDSRDIWMFDGTNFTPLGNQTVKNYFYNNLNSAYVDRIFMVNNTQKYQMELYYPDLTSTGWCNKMLSYRYDLQVWNAPKDVQNACNGCEGPYYSGSFNNALRTVVYAQGSVSSSQIIQTNTGNSFCGNTIDALFQRDNIELITPDGPVPFSSKVYIHRLLPEISGSGVVTVTVGGANSTAQTPVFGQTGTMTINTDSPWVTTQQNTVRTVSLKIETNDSTSTWNATAVNWQATITEDAF